MNFLKSRFIILILSIIHVNSFAQLEDTLKSAALQIINNSDFCTLITIDSSGFPAARIMQSLTVAEDFVIWLGTKPITQKVNHIKAHPEVSVYYTENSSTTYVNIKGKAEIITSNEMKKKYWKEGWESFYPDREKDFVLLKVSPVSMQIVSYSMGIISEKENWAADEVVFTNP